MKSKIKKAAVTAAVFLLCALTACSGSLTSGSDADNPASGNADIDSKGGKRYYTSDGGAQANTIVGDPVDGYYYTNEDGVVDNGYCNGVIDDGTAWIVIEGQAYQVITESDQCLFRAAQSVAACTDSSMTREEKLKACFDYIREHNGEGVLHDPPYPPSNSDWHIVYANDIFVYEKGDCYSYGAAYAYMARAIGYTEAYACNSTGHGWAEVEEKVYDPEWSMHSDNYSYYAMSYDEKCDVPYKSALMVGEEYKHQQIVINE